VFPDLLSEALTTHWSRLCL
jgi:hypothetical protein